MRKHEYICRITEVVASKSTCDRAHVGAVFVNDYYEILATGYNGAPRGLRECDNVGHLLDNGHCVRTVHAEQNAIVQAARRGVELGNATLYCTHDPCAICAKMLINLDVKEVRVKEVKFNSGMEFLSMAGIIVTKWDNELDPLMMTIKELREEE